MPIEVFANNYAVKQEQLRQTIQKQTQDSAIRLQKTTSNLFRHRKKLSNKLDVRAFNQVLSLDTDKRVAEVEGMTPYSTLVEKTLAHGFLPTVVPELKSITVGGALAGIGIESSSFKFGLVHETIPQFDVLLTNGEIINCQAQNEHAELFHAFPNSYGTLGYALKVTVPLIPAKPFVALRYLHFIHAQDFFAALEDACNSADFDYLDGVIFSPQEMVLITGQFVESAPYTSNYKFMKIFYQAVRKKSQDYLTTSDYIWRWDTDWFWCSKVFYLQNPVLRFLLGKWLLNSVNYSKIMRLAKRIPLLQHFGNKRESVIQDVAIPIAEAKNFYRFFHQHIGISPLWICPTRCRNEDFSLFPLQKNQLYINFGFWDMLKSNHPPGFYNKQIETQVKKLNGIKSLYSNVYYEENEFWQLYDKVLYSSLKQKYDPKNRLSDIYSKCTEKK